MKKIVLIAAFLGAALPAARFAAAQSETYPARPVRLIVAFPPGGSVTWSRASLRRASRRASGSRW